jgi:regulator of PEP synthase PpsR (kinase-PPPase family)
MKKIYVLSDSTGETAERVVRAALSQFGSTEVRIVRLAKVGNLQELQQAVATVTADVEGLLVYTLVDSSLAIAVQTIAKEHGLMAFDLLSPLLHSLSVFLGSVAQSTPGLLHQIDTDYFRRMEAVNFTVKHDDGQENRGLCKADLVLVGVSRSSKTPLSMYLANKGYKVANVPLVKGIDPPEELDGIDPRKVVGLVISPKRLVEIRSSRLVTMGQSMKNSYADYEKIEDEIAFCRKYYRQHPGWLIIDVTCKSVEESASEILRRMVGQFVE